MSIEIDECHEWISLHLEDHRYYLPAWLYSPVTALACLIADAHSSLSTAFSSHFLTNVRIGLAN
jgi:hypothetical protein